MKLNSFLFLIIVLGGFIFSGCKRHNNPDVHFLRFEQLLFSQDENESIYERLKNEEDDYRFLFNGSLEDSLYLEDLESFTDDLVLKEIYDTVQKYYADLSWLENDLKKGLRNSQKHFPEFNPTHFYTLITDNFDYFDRILVIDSFLAISMNMYVVEYFNKYDFGLPVYMINVLNKDEILPDCFSAIGYYLLGENEVSETLLDYMITAGKVLYFMDEAIPDVNDRFKIRYNKDQFSWVKENESLVWAYILERDFLYDRDFLKIRHLVNEGPATQGFEGSPSRLGQYIGWQIVRKYMSKNNVSLPELFAMTDSQKILSDSGYKPKRK